MTINEKNYNPTLTSVESNKDLMKCKKKVKYSYRGKNKNRFIVYYTRAYEIIFVTSKKVTIIMTN